MGTVNVDSVSTPSQLGQLFQAIWPKDLLSAKSAVALWVCVALSVPLWLIFIMSLIGPSDVWSALRNPDGLTIAQLGALGDSFAPLTCLFSGLAFAGVLMTLAAQKTEMTAMREQMRVDRINDLLLLLMGEFQRARADITLRRGSNRQVTGSDAVFELTQEIQKQLKLARARSPKEDPLISLRSAIRDLHNPMLRELSVSGSQYLSLVSSMVELIYSCPADDRKTYRPLVESFFSTQDFFLSHYYFLANKDPDFHKKVESIAFFESIGAIPALVLMDGGPYFLPSAYACPSDQWDKMVEAKNNQIKST